MTRRTQQIQIGYHGRAWGFRGCSVCSGRGRGCNTSRGGKRAANGPHPNSYPVTYTDGNGCSSSSDAINATVVIVDVSIAENEKELELIVFPNPTVEILNIESNELIDNIIITDLNGKIVYLENNVNQKLVQVDVSELMKGIYLIRINSGNAYSVKKIIKK